MRRGLSSIVGLAALVLAPAAWADGLEPRFGLHVGSLSGTGVAAEEGFNLRFTPRLPAFGLDSAQLSLSLTPLESFDGPVGVQPFAPTTQDTPQGQVRGFAIGGALALDDVVLRGSFRQRAGRGGREDVYGTSLSFHQFSTGFGYSEVERASGGVESRYALGAELDAGSGLNVGASLMYRQGDGDGAETTGVVRFRLAF